MTRRKRRNPGPTGYYGITLVRGVTYYLVKTAKGIRAYWLHPTKGWRFTGREI